MVIDPPLSVVPLSSPERSPTFAEKVPDAEALLLSGAERAALLNYATWAARRASQAATRCAILLADLAERSRHGAFTALPTKDAYELRQRIVDYAVALRATGILPESVVIQIKRLVRESLAESVLTSSLMQSAVTWAIKGYYRR